MKTLTIIIPVSSRESLKTIQTSMNAFRCIDLKGFDAKIIYAIDMPSCTRQYYQTLKLYKGMDMIWVTDTTLMQAGAYNAALIRSPNADFYAFFDIDAVPSIKFFRNCADVDADFVSCDRHTLNTHHNNITKTIREEYNLCNAGRKLMNNCIGKFFPASCTGLIRGKVLHDFTFTEATSADSELYRHILCNDFTMGYAMNAYYIENAPETKESLYNQRLRWFSDTWRTCVKTVGSSNSWKENISNLLMYSVGMFPIMGLVAMMPFVRHIKGHNFISHSIYMQYTSLIALAKVIKGDSVEWK